MALLGNPVHEGPGGRHALRQLDAAVGIRAVTGVVVEHHGVEPKPQLVAEPQHKLILGLYPSHFLRDAQHVFAGVAQRLNDEHPDVLLLHPG